MSQIAPRAVVTELNEKTEATHTRICTMCHESVGPHWAGRICRACFIESEGFTSEGQYNAAERADWRERYF